MRKQRSEITQIKWIWWRRLEGNCQREEPWASAITEGQERRVKTWDDWSTMPNEFKRTNL